MAGLRVHVVMPAALVERIDAALAEGQSRGEFVRRAVEQALEASGSRSSRITTPAPAEQPETPDFTRDGGMVPLSAYRSSGQAKRDVRPVPKGGKS